MTKEIFAKASKVVDKPSNVKIDIRLCTIMNVLRCRMLNKNSLTIKKCEANQISNQKLGYQARSRSYKLLFKILLLE